MRFGRRIVAPCHDSSSVVSVGKRSMLRYAKHAQVAIENALPNASIAIATSATGLLPLTLAKRLSRAARKGTVGALSDSR